jgi:hypothetical protein
MDKHNIGTVVQVIGPVLDIRFADGELPNLLSAIEIQNGDRKVTAEVAQHIGDNVVRCIAMSSTDGLRRGIEAVNTGGRIVQIVQMPLVQIQPAPFQNVHFTAVEQLHAVKNPWRITEVPEVNGIHSTGDARAVFRNADELQISLGSRKGQLPDGAEGMATHDGVHMHIRNKRFHKHTSFQECLPC